MEAALRRPMRRQYAIAAALLLATGLLVWSRIDVWRQMDRRPSVGETVDKSDMSADTQPTTADEGEAPKRVAVSGPEPSPSGPSGASNPTSDEVRRPSQHALEEYSAVLAMETEHFGSRVKELEALAGTSEVHYVEFLHSLVDYEMRLGVKQSLDAGEAVLVTHDPHRKVFDRPYLRCTTSDTINGGGALICVPVPKDSKVEELRKAWQEANEALLHSVVATHNAKPDAERAAVIKEFRERYTLPGLTKETAPWILYRLQAVDGDLLEIQSR